MNDMHEKQIEIEANPFKSKAFAAAITNTDAHTIVEHCMDEIISGIHLTTMDLPFYCAAFEMLKSSLMTRMDNRDMDMYSLIMETSKVFTMSKDEYIKEDDTEEDNPDEE